jgi:hypothetical protein
MSSEIHTDAALLPREGPLGTHASWRGPQSRAGGFKENFSPMEGRTRLEGIFSLKSPYTAINKSEA